MLQKYYVYAAIVIAIVGMLTYQHVRIGNLEATVAELTTDKVVLETNNFKLKSVIDEQNEAIEKVAAQYTEKLDQYNELRSRPAEVRYKTVYKEVPSIGVNSDECNDIKKLIDDIRSSGY